MTTTKCNNCNWVGEDEDLLLIEFNIYDECETPTATEDKNGYVIRLGEVPLEKDFLKGCPNCKTDSYLIDIIMKFVTHTQEIVEGQRLTDALNKVADKMVENAKAIRVSKYANHITEIQKDFYLQQNLEFAEQVRAGYYIDNLGIWQRVNTELTGECIALLK